MVTDEQFDFYVNEVRQMKKELNDKIDSVKMELNDKIDSVKTELNDKIDNVKSELALTRTELKAEIARGRKETMDLREDYLEEIARNSQQHIDIIKLMQSKVQDLDERKADKELRLLNS